MLKQIIVGYVQHTYISSVHDIVSEQEHKHQASRHCSAKEMYETLQRQCVTVRVIRAAGARGIEWCALLRQNELLHTIRHCSDNNADTNTV